MVRFRKKYINSTVFIDVILCVVLILITLIAPKIPPTVELKPQAMLTMTWDEPVDIDLHIIAPDGHLSFQNKDVGQYLSLNRDDLGFSNKSQLETNTKYEVAEWQELKDGQYRVAGRWYGGDSKSNSIAVNLTFQTLSPYRQYLDETVVFLEKKQTIPVATITIQDGKVVAVDTDVEFLL